MGSAQECRSEDGGVKLVTRCVLWMSGRGLTTSSNVRSAILCQTERELKFLGEALDVVWRLE